MRKSALVAILVVLLGASGALAAQISGHYIEARTAAVYIGACFANSEVGLAGQEAVMGWRVTSGSWDGVPLAGLSVVGVVRARNTLGEPRANPASAILIVDQKATPEQERALVGFVRSQDLNLFARVLHVDRAPIEFVVGGGRGSGHDGHGLEARLIAGDLARIVTRAMHDDDAPCAAAELYYPPLTRAAQAEPALAISNEYRGNGLGSVWSQHNRPSAFVGTFER